METTKLGYGTRTTARPPRNAVEQRVGGSLSSDGTAQKIPISGLLKSDASVNRERPYSDYGITSAPSVKRIGPVQIVNKNQNKRRLLCPLVTETRATHTVIYPKSSQANPPCASAGMGAWGTEMLHWFITSTFLASPSYVALHGNAAHAQNPCHTLTVATALL
ncbi:hypothetical protein HPB50_000464 [Hyalomma asiaticum]|uniref:Uncharacterized protein n=1 Tax=Hyalomma asiaticum TaxID=266040 RepID=A0ACB7T0M9_HYAAI|nr:hypothetical protein HPB50_000464 [Hyalomma asiaticum]